MSPKHTPQYDKRRGTYYVFIRRDGVRRYFNLGTSKKAALNALSQLENDIAAGKVSFGEVETTQVIQEDGAPDIHVTELAVKHLEWMEEKRAKRTFENRQHYVIQFLDFIGDVMVSQITRVKLEQFYVWARNNHGRSENGGNEHLAGVKAMLRWGEEMELCELAFKRFPTIERTPPETKRIEDEDLTRLLSAASDDFRDLLMFGLITGLRPLELRELTHDQIRHDKQGRTYIHIERHKTSKTARTPRPRSVPLSNPAEEIVERQFKAHPHDPHVFLNGIGTPYTRYSLKTRLRNLCLKAGTSRIYPPYALRHTFASMESDEGIESTSLALLMGHSTTRTLSRYVANTSDSHRRAVEAAAKRVARLTKSK